MGWSGGRTTARLAVALETRETTRLSPRSEVGCSTAAGSRVRACLLVAARLACRMRERQQCVDSAIGVEVRLLRGREYSCTCSLLQSCPSFREGTRMLARGIDAMDSSLGSRNLLEFLDVHGRRVVSTACHAAQATAHAAAHRPSPIVHRSMSIDRRSAWPNRGIWHYTMDTYLHRFTGLCFSSVPSRTVRRARVARPGAPRAV